jgi:hypothetical protein
MKNIASFSKLDAKVVCLIDDGQTGPCIAAIKYLEAGVVEVCTLSQLLDATLEARFKRSLLGQRVSWSAPLGIDLPDKRSVFVATSFSRVARSLMANAVAAALDRNGWVTKFGDEVFSSKQDIGTKQAEVIKECGYVIANVGAYPPASGRHNPNVYFEIGLARAFGVDILPVRPSNETGPLPVDLHTYEYLTYHGAVDLALSLRKGLWELLRERPATDA